MRKNTTSLADGELTIQRENNLLSARMLDLLRTGEEIEQTEAKAAGELGFMAQAMVMATLPHTNPGDVSQWVRTNGNFALAVQSGLVMEKGKPILAGIPYGSKPRLLIAWASTEAVRTRQRTLELGGSLTEFMQTVGVVAAGGSRGTIAPFRDQMRRTFTANFSSFCNDSSLDAAKQFKVATEFHIWWTPQSPEQAALWKSTLELDSSFYEALIARPVPIDLRALRALKQSPMALDIYMWMTYRNSYLRRATKIPWTQLMQQFGCSIPGVPQFKHFYEKNLQKVLSVYPALRVDTDSDFLILKPSPTSVIKG